MRGRSPGKTGPPVPGLTRVGGGANILLSVQWGRLGGRHGPHLQEGSGVVRRRRVH